VSKAHVRRLKLRLFLEGVEVPVIAANIQTAPNSPMVASIQVPPLAEGTRLLPRTIVHLFFLDDAFTSHVSRSIEADTSPDAHERELEEEKARNSLNELGNVEEDLRNWDYKLLFGGEVIGWQWSKNQTQRSLVLQCEDFSNYWDYAMQSSNTDIFGPSAKAVFSGSATNLFTDFLESKGSIITGLVSKGKCDSFPQMEGLGAGIIRLIEAVGGSYYPPARFDKQGKPVTVRKYAGQNIFFSLAELRLHITHMVMALEKDPTTKRLIERQGYSSLFERSVGGLGGQVSIRKCMNALTKIIFHEMYAQPCPKYIQGLGGTVSGKARKSLTSDISLFFIAANANAIKRGSMGVIDFIDNAREDTTAGFIAAAGGASALRKEQQTKLLNLVKICRQIMVQIGRLRRAELETVKSFFSSASTLLGRARVQLSRWQPKSPESVFRPIQRNLLDVYKLMDRARHYSYVTTNQKYIRPARLCQQIFRPDVWFSAPPRCNVLFPENYFQMDYQRMFLQEPTRFLLKTNDEFFGEDFLFDQYYFAPQAGSLKKDQVNLRDMLRRDLLDHELFTGILPVFEKMGEFNIFASKGYDKRKALKKVSYAQRAANFIYFKHRFNSRQMRVSARFNPYVACGFPGLIIDRYVDAESIALHNELRQRIARDRGMGEYDMPPLELSESLGTNFLGNFTMTSHNVNASGQGRTEITCSYPRQPEESVEFLGTVEKEQTVRKKVDTTVRTTGIAALFPPKLYSVGPNGGRITSVVDVTSRYADGGHELPIFVGRLGRRTDQGKLELVPIGTPVSGRGRNSERITYLAGDETRRVVFHAFHITEDVPRYQREPVELPAEEYIRPGWYDDIWTTSRIGKVYDEFFSTGAITDPHEIKDAAGASTGQASEEAERAAAEANDAQRGDDPAADAVAALTLQEGTTIQQAVDYLLLTYSYIKQQNLDVDEFIKAYTWRPIASMVDIFGTSDLELDKAGRKVVSGREGFHSRAFGPYEDLFGLVGPDLEDILGIKRGSTVSQKGDTRKRKFLAVQRFASALRFSKALIG
jgi:hypothetical protein